MKALVTGCGGQDGYFISKYLNRAGVSVYGLTKPGSAPLNSAVGNHLHEIYEVDLTDFDQVSDKITTLLPDIIVNLAAQADSWGQFSDPIKLFETNTVSVINVLETIRATALSTRFYQASSSEIFAGGTKAPQSLNSAPAARTLYGASKISSDEIVRVYRQHYGMACARIVFFSHESPLRKPGYFSSSLVNQAIDVAVGKKEKIVIYSPDSTRDWGYAGEYCRRVVDHINSRKMEDIIVGSGIFHTVREFAQEVCKQMGLEYKAVVVEHDELVGRAKEMTLVYAKSNSDGFLGDKLSYDLPKLIKLLIRFAKLNRKNEK